ncbi:MAG: efflux RND transporter periplasmic adaptor subunit [Bradyrhizobium sp.]
MNRAVTLAAVAAIAAAGGIGGSLTRQGQLHVVIASPALAQGGAGPLYYRDPDGKPLYSPTPKKTPDGRDYVAVPAGADISFEPKPAPEPPATADGPRKIKYYRNPMGLPDTSPVPKKDSMGMDYIPVYEGEDSDDGSVKLSPGKIQRTGVQSEAARTRVIRTAIRASGTIQLDERRISVVSMRSESFVLKVADVTTGSHVVKGQPLIEVYSPAVTSAAAEYIATITSKTTGGDNAYGRGSRQRLINLDVPEAALAEIERSRNVPTSIQWTVPRDGIVLERSAIEGMRAQPGDVLFKIADHSVIWALIDIAERDLGGISLGQRVVVKARSFPEREFVGKLEVIYPEINRETRTARVRAVLQSPEQKLLHDMYVEAEIEVGKQEPVLAVPESALLDTGTRQTVLVDKGGGRFEPREVKIGQRGGGYVEVRDGLADGEPVVTSANFLIDAESNLKAALKGLGGGQP